MGPEKSDAEAEGAMVGTRAWGRGNGELVFTGTEFQFGKTKMGMQGGDGWTTTGCTHVPEPYT